MIESWATINGIVTRLNNYYKTLIDFMPFKVFSLVGATQCRELIGNIPLNRTFLLFCREVERFTKSVCQDCEYYGTPDCFRNEFRCAEDDRDKYREDSWFSLQREVKKERKRLAFP